MVNIFFIMSKAMQVDGLMSMKVGVQAGARSYALLFRVALGRSPTPAHVLGSPSQGFTR